MQCMYACTLAWGKKRIIIDNVDYLDIARFTSTSSHTLNSLLLLCFWVQVHVLGNIICIGEIETLSQERDYTESVLA